MREGSQRVDLNNGQIMRTLKKNVFVCLLKVFLSSLSFFLISLTEI